MELHHCCLQNALCMLHKVVATSLIREFATQQVDPQAQTSVLIYICPQCMKYLIVLHFFCLGTSCGVVWHYTWKGLVMCTCAGTHTLMFQTDFYVPSVSRITSRQTSLRGCPDCSARLTSTWCTRGLERTYMHTCVHSRRRVMTEKGGSKDDVSSSVFFSV